MARQAASPYVYVVWTTKCTEMRRQETHEEINMDTKEGKRHIEPNETNSDGIEALRVLMKAERNGKKLKNRRR